MTSGEVISLIVTLVTTIASIWLTISLTFSSINKKLDYLTTREKSELTYAQAVSMADLYIFHVQSVINLKASHFIDEKFMTAISDSNDHSAERFINELTQGTIEAAKDKFSSFHLYGGGNFSDLIKALLEDDASVTEKTRKSAIKLFQDCSKNGVCGEALKTKFINLISQSGKESKTRIIEALKKRYDIK